MKTKVSGFICILIVIAASFFSYGLYNGYFEKIEESDIITTNSQLSARVNEELEKGSSSFTVYIENISDLELKNVNEQLDGFYGHVDTFSNLGTYRRQYKKVTFQLNISDNYFVYENYVNGVPIDPANKSAIELSKQVKKIMKSIIKKGMSDYEKELAIHDYIVKNGEYGFLKGKNEPYSYRTYGILVKGKGVCNSYAESMQLLLTLAGVESRIIVGTADNIDHAWNLVKLDNKWYHIDSTWDDPVPNEPGRSLRTYFNVTDKMMKTTHTWIEDNYPKAANIDMNYYNKNNLYCKNYEEFKEKVLKLLESKPTEIDLLVADYNKDKYLLDFIFDVEYVSNISWQSYGEAPCTTVTIGLTYFD